MADGTLDELNAQHAIFIKWAIENATSPDPATRLKAIIMAQQTLIEAAFSRCPPPAIVAALKVALEGVRLLQEIQSGDCSDPMLHVGKKKRGRPNPSSRQELKSAISHLVQLRRDIDKQCTGELVAETRCARDIDKLLESSGMTLENALPIGLAATKKRAGDKHHLAGRLADYVDKTFWDYGSKEKKGFDLDGRNLKRLIDDWGAEAAYAVWLHLTVEKVLQASMGPSS